MGDSTIRLLIAEDNLEICDILEDFFALTPQITVCGVAHDGNEALFRIAQSQPDVVLLDLIMPKTDGIAVLERLNQAELLRRPGIIVTSAIGQEGFTNTALALGANYYMIKPYDLTALLSRICLVASLAGAPRENAEPAGRASFWERRADARAEKARSAAGKTADAPNRSDAAALIYRTLMETGLPTHMLGFRYCVSAVRILLRENRPCSMVKEVYSAVAREFDTTSACVEGAIRKAIRRAWEQRDGLPLAGLRTADMETPPANGRFLNALSAQICVIMEDHAAEEAHEPI